MSDHIKRVEDIATELDAKQLLVELIRLSNLHETMRCSWEQREKNLRALRARLVHDA